LTLAVTLSAAPGFADGDHGSTALEKAGVEEAEDEIIVRNDAAPTVKNGVVRSATVVLQTGDTPFGAPGAVTSFNSPFTNGAGAVGFTGTAGEGFVWRDAGITWLNSDAVGNTLAGGESTMGIGDDGQFIYSPSLNGEDSVWTHNGLLAVENTQAPGFATGTVSTFHSRPTMCPDGRTFWVSGFNESGGTTTEGRMLYTSNNATPAATQVVLRSDDMIGGFAIDRPSGIDFDYQGSDDGTHLIAVLFMDTGSSVDDGFLYVDGALVAREADPSGEGDNWDNFDSVSINDDGDYLFSGDTDSDTSADEFIAMNGAIAIREGDTIDGVQLTTAASVLGLSLNNRGEAVHAWTTGSGAGEHLFVATDAAQLASTSMLVLSTGDAIDLDGDGASDATVTDLETSPATGPGLWLAENARVYVEVELDDGITQFETILAMDVPLTLFADDFETGDTGTWSSAVP
jgi:hypothetical protein